MISESLLGQTRRFKSDGAEWICTVISIENGDTARVRIQMGQSESEVLWNEGELQNHGFWA